ncbi:MAG: lytic transglycosylase domain-containing protein [Syntrophobacteraceae bacterium]
MAPDSSLLGHQLGGKAFGFRLYMVGVVALCLVSVLCFTFQAQASTRKNEVPGALAALSPSPDSIKKESLVSPVSSPSVPDIPAETPSVLWRNRIQIPIKEPLIQKYIRYYQRDGRRTFSDALERAKTCIPQMTEILESHGVPAELVWIVLVESRFEKHASYRGAGGYWQMLAGTARSLGLRVDKSVDERRDLIKSTKAAAKYLKQLNERYDSWLLALAAYNAGGGPISCAAGKSRCVKDWELNGHRYLPARSRVYAAKTLAAIQVMREPEMYGFESPNYCKPKDFDPIMVGSPVHLKEIARWIDVPVSHLMDLNPSLRHDAMSLDTGFALRLPSGSREKFDLAYEVHRRR